MTDASDSSFRVLHALRCIGVAGLERVASASGLPPETANVALWQLADHDLAVLESGPFGGWSLTEKGRERDRGWIEAELEATGARAGAQDAYQRFLRLNPTLLQVCSDWQMRKFGDEIIVNDHADEEYDVGVMSRLFRIDDEVQGICAELAGRLRRFEPYGSRLADALQRSMGGDHAAVADDLESYHNVWFQLHEDLLATLGIPRGQERGEGR